MAEDDCLMQRVKGRHGDARMRSPMNPNPSDHDECSPADAFAGRRNELRELRAAADCARAGTASIVLVQGAPGIGKTTLVRRFLGELTDFTVLAGVAPPSAAPVAFESLARMLRPTRVPAQARNAHLQQRQGTAVTDHSTAGSHALRRFLDSSAAPVVLFLDDAQWADGATLRALVAAARPGSRLCVLLGARRTQIWDEETRRALRMVPRVSLTELDDADATALVGLVLGKAADRAMTRQFVLRSGRHPHYLKSLLTSHGMTDPAQESWPPRMPAAVVQRQLRGLTPADSEALEALAVLGGTASLPTLGRVLGVSECASLLDGLAREDFVVRTSSAVPTVAIRHAVLRDALYDNLPSTRRRALHLAAAQAVDWSQGLAHKVAAAERADPALTADLMGFVAHELGEGRLVPAARTLVSAARLSGAEDHLADHLLYGAIRILFWAGADAEIAQHATAVATRRPCPWRDEALGLTEFASGRLTSAGRLLERAHESLNAVNPRQHGVVLTELAMVHAILGQGEATQQRAAQALHPVRSADAEAEYIPMAPARSCARPGPCGDAPAVVIPPGTDRAARALSAYGAALRQGPRSGLALLTALPEDADKITEEDLPALTVRGILRVADGQLATGAADLTMALVRGRPGGARLFGAGAALHLATCHLLTGDWDRAAREIDAGLDDEQGRAFDAAALWSLRCVLEAFRGDGRAADACLAQAEKLAQGLDFAGPQYHTAMARALSARSRGDHRGVVAALQVLAHYVQHSERVRLVATSWLPLLAESLIVCGFADQARAAMSGPGAADGTSNILLAVTDAWLHGRLAEAAGENAEAMRRYSQAVDTLEPGRDVPLLRGLLEISCGRVSAAMGQTEISARHFDTAEALFTRLGAQAFLAECRTHRQAPFGAQERDVLTEREREVARLVGLGHTNREIADDLRLSVKTIEYHLRSVFAKLAVHNRRELRRRVQAGGI
ncbi:AAA family ATPase [Streptomyces collinus]|uniref:AAA family ATPase n=1 Tax=Streptomyces collinus TaxID=42684 RepID=UPI0036BD2D72